MNHPLDAIPGEPWQQSMQSEPLGTPGICGACHHPAHGKDPCSQCEAQIQAGGEHGC